MGTAGVETGTVFRAQTLWSLPRVCILLPLSTSLQLAKLLKLQFSHLQSADDNTSCVKGFLQILNVLVFVKHLEEQCLIFYKCY